MRIAIVCDWLVVNAGAERVLAEILHCYPTADVFAVCDFVPAVARDFLQHKKIITTFIQKMPWARRHYRQYLPLMPFAIEQLDLAGYDLVISSSHAVAKGVLTGPDQVHISYVHTPIRYAWDLQHQYLREAGMATGVRSGLARCLLQRIRNWDVLSAGRPDFLIANSQYIARRIQKCWRRDARVIHPPVDVARFTPRADKSDFYLTASRLVPYKRVDLIVESFAAMPDKKLIVIGEGPQLKKIRAAAAGYSNITIMGYQPTTVLIDHLQRAKAFVFAAEEDFGILPLEAQACGTPVIAFGRGGALETVRGIDQDDATGVFFNMQSPAAICEAINVFEQQRARFVPAAFQKHVAQFAPAIFREKFKVFISSCMYPLHKIG